MPRDEAAHHRDRPPAPPAPQPTAPARPASGRDRAPWLVVDDVARRSARERDAMRAAGTPPPPAALLRYPGDHVVPRHELPEARVELLLAGPHPETCAGIERTCVVGVAHDRPPEVVVSGRVGPAGATEFTLALPGPVRSFPRAPHGDPRLTALAARALGEATDPDRGSPLAVESLVHEMIALLCGVARADRTAPPWLARIVERLHQAAAATPDAHGVPDDDAAGAPVTLDELARLADVDPSHLVRTFRRHLGCTPGAYERAVRLRAAAAAIAAGDRPLAHVALDHGFADQSHLGRHFRRTVGTTPAAFRSHVSRAARL